MSVDRLRTSAKGKDSTRDVFTALAHPARRQILVSIVRHGGSMPAGEIARSFNQSWPTTTRHLKILEGAGLLRLERSGRSRIYRIHRPQFDAVGDWLRLVQPSGHEVAIVTIRWAKGSGVVQPPANPVDPESLVGPEWAEWYRLTPVQRWQESEKLWQTFTELGGSLDPEPDTQSPFFDAGAPGQRAPHGRPGVRVVRRGGV
ncbi:MAG: hypothetical protein FD129_1253 [bacterium]|nr:MAG: hypothetical protein FD129_1253 [bacterium]